MSIQRVIISGGGTGGHIFPAVAIADEIKRRNPSVAILFVGAIGKMEMEKVPQAGYEIVGLPIAGLQRKLTLSNFLLPFKILKSLWKARSIVKNFKPQLVIGVGGYASGPTLQMANMLGVPTLIQEQNSFPGKTNQLLAKKAAKICTAYSGMDQFFPTSKIIQTGNPVRNLVSKHAELLAEAQAFFHLDPSKKTILVIGGSLGARTLNESVLNHIQTLAASNVQVIWQCGKNYLSQIEEQFQDSWKATAQVHAFIQRMDLAYAAADVIISRAGALSVSELTLIGKPCILVPSPNVAEDHQTKNAMALVKEDAAVLVRDAQSKETLVPIAIELLNNPGSCEQLAKSIRQLAKPNACMEIVDACESII
ncbi:MAG: undecaprenyldiphospho-muramoylpentapeptide beta-N-acetylglucosaminyltransferase [Crocinitomicaceae bacterium]|nr:undecaprenyldiphospho-muramoylpentapeptide beta-N-acetylglucosaminyltransferase [Crocinitomicaceae bacterium]MBP6033125.1 undecaprenyldiphospho-muramoylpentapeptide beta-N-acetylglucosaminyltransferase [Crocinitomicaceae bacterium]